MSSLEPLLPLVTPDVADFWRGGEVGELRIKRCDACGAYAHPSLAVCRSCRNTDLTTAVVSGRGTVVAVSVNHQQWHPAFAPPYAIVIVALEEDSDVRLTSRVTGCDPDAVAIGMPVEVRFEPVHDIWLPLFTPAGGTLDEVSVRDEPQPARRPARISSDRFEDRVAISGIGMSQVGRRLHRPAMALAAEAAYAAIQDAGLMTAEIDGISTYPGSFGPNGFSEGGVTGIEEALGLQPVWHNGGVDLPGQAGAVVTAALAVASGLCRHVLCVRTVWESTWADLVRSQSVDPGAPPRATGFSQWMLPFGSVGAPTWLGLFASRYLVRYGATRELFGIVAVSSRANAALNPNAVYQDPITMDDYLGARLISTPFGLLDCDVPCDGSVAIVVSAVDAAESSPHGPVRLAAVGTRATERMSWDQGTLTHEPQTFGPAQHLWERTDLKPADVDFACLYDGFTFNCVSWIEALGFCGIGETSDWIDDGRRIALGGDLPINPHGGQLSAGRLHGFGYIHEAVTQLRGHAGGRQVPGAEVAVVATGGGTPGSCLLLTGDR